MAERGHVIVEIEIGLVVFAGGSEATITGALLLGFGFGWACWRP